MNRNPVAIFVVVSLLLTVTCADAQQAPPVLQVYLSPVSIETDDARLVVDFSLQKDGGLRDHSERQAHLLVYLKSDEKEILKIAAGAEFPKADAELQSFVEMMTQQRLIVPVATKLSTRLAGKQAPAKQKYHFPRDSFPFQFEFDDSDLLTALQNLEHFDQGNEIGDPRSQNTFGLMVFVPLNNSPYANLIPARLRKLGDHGRAYKSWAHILYFRPLNYDFRFEQQAEDWVLYIN